MKLSERHCKLLNYLKQNLRGAHIDDEDAIDARTLLIEPYAQGLTPRNIKLTQGCPDTTVTDVLETEQVKRSRFKT